MPDKNDPATHEVFSDSKKAKPPIWIWIGLVVVLVIGGSVVFMSSPPETQQTQPAQPEKVTYWYTEASITDATFGGFLTANLDDKRTIAGSYLSSTLWKDRLLPNSDQEELRPYADKLVTETILMVASSDVAIDAPINEVFDRILAKPKIAERIGPPL